MHENFEVGLATKMNENNELEINEFTKDDLLNKTFYGKNRMNPFLQLKL